MQSLLHHPGKPASRMGSHTNKFAGLARNLIHHPGKLDGVRIRQVICKELY